MAHFQHLLYKISSKFYWSQEFDILERDLQFLHLWEVYLSNRPQASGLRRRVVYKFFEFSTNIPSGLSAYNP